MIFDLVLTVERRSTHRIIIPSLVFTVHSINDEGDINKVVRLSRHEVFVEVDKMGGRHGAPRPPMTDVGTETAFRLEKAQAFPKK